MKPLFPDDLYDNWKRVYTMTPGVDRDHQMQVVGRLARGNLRWMIRQLIGGVPSDREEDVKHWIAKGEMCEPSDFTRKRRYENLKRKNKQHS